MIGISYFPYIFSNDPWPGLVDMIREEKTIYFELSTGPTSSYKFEHTFPMNGAREAIADFPCLE